MKLEGKVAFVTGGGRGIGRAIALALAGEGADIAVAARGEGEILAVSSEVEGLGRRALPLRMDVTRPEEVERGVGRALESFGRIDVLVNNAGAGHPLKPLVELSYEEWRRVMEVNLDGVFLCLKAALPSMMARRSGSIINISSGLATRGTPLWVAYSATKWGIEGLTKGLALELKDYDIRVNSLNPGRVETRTFPRVPGDNQPYRRPEEIGHAVIYLASDDSRGVTGRFFRAADFDPGGPLGHLAEREEN